MCAVLIKGYTFGATESVTNAKLHALVDSATITGIVNADVDAGAAIAFSKIAQSDIDGSKLVGLANIVSGAGVIPKENLTSVAQKGANADITSLTGLTTLLSRAQGGLASNVANNAASGVVFLDANSKISVAQLGAWVDKTASYGAQQVTTDGFVVAKGSATAGSAVILIGYTDGNANPTTERNAGTSYLPSNTSYAGVSFFVRKNDYWKIVLSGVGTYAMDVVSWIPWGS